MFRIGIFAAGLEGRGKFKGCGDNGYRHGEPVVAESVGGHGEEGEQKEQSSF